jgi:8-oxo-dGTP pyrophosphatase MutT (NUDIX family)
MRAGRPHLLLFRHPLAGVQLPAGSIEKNESPFAAAIREVVEETGLHDLADPISLGTTTTHLPPSSRILLRGCSPQPAPDSPSRGARPRRPRPPALPPALAGADSSTCRLNRGLTVELLEIAGDEARVRADVLDYNHAPPTLLSRREGWVHTAALGSIIDRHHIHLRLAGPAPHGTTADGTTVDKASVDKTSADKTTADGTTFEGTTPDGTTLDRTTPERWLQVADGHEFAPFWAPLSPRPQICAAQVPWLDFAYDELVRLTSPTRSGLP